MTSRERIDSPRAPVANGYYSQAIEIEGLVFCSGQTPVDPSTGDVVEGGFDAQAHQSLANLREVLHAAGLDLGAVVKTTVFLKDMNNLAAMDAIYRTYFPDPAPARSTIEVARLPKDSQIEIELVAARTRSPSI